MSNCPRGVIKVKDKNDKCGVTKSMLKCTKYFECDKNNKTLNIHTVKNKYEKQIIGLKNLVICLLLNT